MLLPSGRVIVAGGLGQNNIQGSAEQYDPSRDSGRGSFSSAGSLLTPREQATATLLSSGKVLVAGGGSTRPSGAVLPIDSAELYEPVAAGQ